MFFSIVNINVVSLILFEMQHHALTKQFERNLLNGVDSSSVKTFTFSPEETLSLIRPDKHEFKVEDETFDIISEVFENGRVTIRCIADAEEKRIEKAASDMASRSHESDSDHVQMTKVLLFHSQNPSITWIDDICLIEFMATNFVMSNQFKFGVDPHPPDVTA